MRLTPDNKRKITDRILASAARAFRQRGYEDVNLDRIMQGAGLTRGAFYAHFRSKADLFQAVLRHEHPLRRMLARRPDGPPAAMLAGLGRVFRDYLAPENHDKVFEGCTLAALTGDAIRADDAARIGYQAAFDDILAEMARGTGRPAAAFIAPLVLATGAVRTARALHDAGARARVLTAAARSFDAMIEALADTGAQDDRP